MLKVGTEGTTTKAGTLASTCVMDEDFSLAIQSDSNALGYRGIFTHNKKFKARCNSCQGGLYLGCFHSKLAAAHAFGSHFKDFHAGTASPSNVLLGPRPQSHTPQPRAPKAKGIKVLTSAAAASTTAPAAPARTPKSVPAKRRAVIDSTRAAALFGEYAEYLCCRESQRMQGVRIPLSEDRCFGCKRLASENLGAGEEPIVRCRHKGCSKVRIAWLCCLHASHDVLCSLRPSFVFRRFSTRAASPPAAAIVTTRMTSPLLPAPLTSSAGSTRAVCSTAQAHVVAHARA